MIDSRDVGQSFSHEQLPRLHEVTQQIEKTCKAQLRTYIDALAPLFRPRRVLGNHMEGTDKENVPAADRNMNDLRELFFKACGRPFDLAKRVTFADRVDSYPDSTSSVGILLRNCLRTGTKDDYHRHLH